MTRIHDRHGVPPSALDNHRRTDPNRKASYKVIFEEIPGKKGKKKKLKTVLYPKAQAPKGYTFIPAGDPQLTNRCKQIAREEGLTVYIVSTSKNPSIKLSQETHRIGYHFPSVTVEKACTSLGVSLTASGRVLESHLATLDESLAQNRRTPRQPTKKKQKPNAQSGPAHFDMNLSQAVIDTQAREAIKDLFPNIPSRDLHEIVGRAFQKGQGLVGTASDLTLVRRAQLAVIAHIRHEHTDYDKLLKIIPYMDARKIVEQPCLDLLMLWRGDDENADNVEEILREVIVIPDDDEDEQMGDIDQSHSIRSTCENSIELLSADNLQTRTLDYSKFSGGAERHRSHSLESEDSQSIQYLGQAPLFQPQSVAYNQHRLERIGAHRQRMWEEARNRRRQNAPSVYDPNTSLPSPGSLRRNGGPPPAQFFQQQDILERSQPLDPKEHLSLRVPVYTQPISQTRLDGQQDYRNKPHLERRDNFSGNEDQNVLKQQQQTIHPPQQFQRILERRPPKDDEIYYVRDSTLQNVDPRQPNMQPSFEPCPQESTRFVRITKPQPEIVSVPYTSSGEYSTRQHTEMALPSIEENQYGATRKQALRHQHDEHADAFALREATNHGVSYHSMPSTLHGDDLHRQQYIKRRKTRGQQPLSPISRPKTLLIPLDREEEHLDMHPFEHDERIIALPPRETARRYENEPQVHMVSQPAQMKQHNHLVADRVHRDAQSPLSHSLQPEPSHVFSHVKAPSAYANDSHNIINLSKPAPVFEMLDSHASSRRNIRATANNQGTFVDSEGSKQSRERFEEKGHQIHADTRDFKINLAQRQIQRQSEMINLSNRNTTFDPLVDDDISQSKPQHYKFMLEPDDRRREVFESTTYRQDLHPRSLRPQNAIEIETTDAANKLSNGQYVEQNGNLARVQSFELHEPRPNRRSHREDWDQVGQIHGLRQDPISQRALPYRIGYPENSPPNHRSYDRFGRSQRNAQNEVIVLD